MKNIVYCIIFLLLVTTTLAGCKKDPCEDTRCDNGTCVDGTCTCDPGWFGSFCDRYDDCINMNCGHGTCSLGVCNCDPGWMGTNCNTPDPCYGINCSNGYCDNGECICTAPWEGPTCSNPFNAKCNGNYTFIEHCSPSGTLPAYNVYVAPMGGLAYWGFNLTGLWAEPGYTLQAGFDNSGRNFIMPRQPIAQYYELQCFSGRVSANGDTITLSYTIYDGSTSNIHDSCYGTMVRQ